VTTSAVVLATGGFGQAFAPTTNPDGVSGDGMALAARAGAELADVEFVQFHPTVLWQPGGRGRRPLITEALRGAGATLIDHAGRSVMAGVHPLGDLAPRDVVAAAMHDCMGPAGSHLWLDATRVGGRRLEAEFPTVTAACRAVGVDPATEPIPVAPGAHYACGGIRADVDGATSISGLFASGEAASTGAHGANRLASNSLTESLASGRRVGRRLAETIRRSPSPIVIAPGADPSSTGAEPGQRGVLADAMARDAGVDRSGDGLEHIRGELGLVGSAPALDRAAVEATNLHTVSTLVATAALARTESRSCHRRSDFPTPRPSWQRRVLLRAGAGELAVATRALR
jgi:L-aspartate oxidase